MIKTQIATELAAAVKKDEAAGYPPFEIAHGKFGPALTAWIKSAAESIAAL